MVQSFLEGAVDYRIYVVNGDPILMLKRTPGPGSVTANLSSGGKAEWTSEIPDELRPAVEYIWSRLPMPFVAMDFLHDGQQFWLSEIEPDGALIFDEDDATLKSIQVQAARQRFAAIALGHRQHQRGASR